MSKNNISISIQQLIKGMADCLISAFILILLSPVMLIIAIAIYASMGSPVFFIQSRPGKDGQLFNLYKFRTMSDDRNDKGDLQSDEKRLTVIGKFLRKTSLDELPQLWNVLKREMSLVGPRPLIPKYLPYYSTQELKRHDMLPGITGLAQVKGRNELEWNKRLALDVYYVENWSLWLDIKILFKTVYSVLRSDSVVVAPNTIMMDLDVERQHSKP